MTDGVVKRDMAFMGEVLLIAIPPGEKIFDVWGPREVFLGIVYDGHPIINGQTCYLSTNDYNAAKMHAAALGAVLN